MDKRIFVEKKADFRVKSQSLVKELKHNLQLKTLNDLRIVQVYDVFNLAEDLFARAEKHIFSEQVTDTVLDEAAVKADLEKYAFFAIESLPGQFDQRAASSQEALLLLGSSNDVTVNTAQLYLVNKDIDANELEAVKNYLLNPVDSRFKDITVGIAKQDFSESDKTIPSLDFFETYTAEDFAKYKAEQGLAMEVDDLLFIQDYFKSIGRVPTETELKVLDTYWSDHCRHTTFETELKNIDFSTTKTGYAFIKWSVEIQENYSKGKADNSLPILRLGEVLLNYAEAKAELGEMDKSIWNETVGALRERAGVTNIYPEDANYVEDEWLKDYYADSPIKLSNTLLEIRRERVTELIMENGLRVSDLYRWKLGNLIRDRSTGNQGWKGIYLSTDEYNNGFEFNGYKYLFKDQAQGTYSYPIGQSSDDMNYTLSDGDHGYLIYNYKLQWDEKRYVRPIPSTALTKNPNLGQNYGWEQ